jgi:DNA-binding GntR family transcriptional regulator
MTPSSEIAQRIVESVLAQKLEPGARLGEQQLAIVFDCSRTIVREALMQLAVRGIVTVSSRRGWYVVQPSLDEAREAFEARRVIETGLLRCVGPVDPVALKSLKQHVQRERAAVQGADVGLRSFLLGEFHVCLAECLGNSLLADTLRDLTARTTLIAMHHQSSHDAAQSCEDHVDIVDALEQGDAARAETLMLHHLRQVQAGLQPREAGADPLEQLRSALTPVASPPAAAPALHTSSPPQSRRKRDADSTYLGKLL